LTGQGPRMADNRGRNAVTVRIVSAGGTWGGIAKADKLKKKSVGGEEKGD